MSKKTRLEQTSQKRKSKRAKRLKKNKHKSRILGLGIIILICGFYINHFNKTNIYNDFISENIFIEEVDVSKMTKEEATELVKKDYTPQSIKLTYKDNEYEISPQDIDLKYNIEEVVNNAYNYTKINSYFENVKIVMGLKKEKKEFEIKSSYDEAKLSQAMDEISKTINVSMVNAKVNANNSGQISISPSTTGREVNVAANKEAIYEKINTKNYDIIELKVDIKSPRVSTEQAQSVNSVLAEYSTKINNSNPGRTHNVILSAKKSSDILLMPGEEYSYNTLTGMRTVSNGYKDAPVIVNNKLVDALGGGVCQTSSTIFNPVLTSGLKITSRRNHSIASDYVPMGQDAMVNDGGQDFRFKNQFDNPVYIKNIITNDSITTKIYGNSSDKKSITIRVDKFKENGLDATNTYREYRDASGKIIKTEFVGKSVYKKLEK
ncbi:MAG: VanW family protein [Romboutsia sp.]